MKHFYLAILFSVLLGCEGQAPLIVNSQAIQSGEECHVCGMLIKRFPGPKGQIVMDGQHLNFCSTRDMVTFYNDDEHKHRISRLFTHDMSKANWDAPDDDTFMDAKKAWYVVGGDQRGAMGATSVSFSTKKDAQKYQSIRGGELSEFDQLHTN